MKSDLIDRRIAELEHELAKLRMRKVVQLQEELSQLQADISGTRTVKEPKGWASGLAASSSASAAEKAPRRSGGRGKRISDEEVVARLQRVVAAAGSEGVSARAAALQAGVFYLRAIKAMGESFVKHGSGKWTRYTLK